MEKKVRFFYVFAALIVFAISVCWGIECFLHHLAAINKSTHFLEGKQLERDNRQHQICQNMPCHRQ